LRQAFLLKRVERRQAEALIGETEEREAITAERRGQQSLDDWFRSRLYREAAAVEDSGTVADGPVSQELATMQASQSDVEGASEKLETESTRSGCRAPESE
jgi:hypothetical protein